MRLSSTDDGLPGRVESVTPFFAERHLLLEVRNGSDLWRMNTPLDAPVKVGDVIRAQFDAESLLFFDAKTGIRIG